MKKTPRKRNAPAKRKAAAKPSPQESGRDEEENDEEPVGEWRRLGVIGIASGICMVGDPCFVLHEEKLSKDFGPDWQAFTERVGDRERESGDDAAQFFFDGRRAIAGLAVALHTGYGDGTYGVWGRFDGAGCLELRIKFDEYADWEPVKVPSRRQMGKPKASRS